MSEENGDNGENGYVKKILVEHKGLPTKGNSKDNELEKTKATLKEKEDLLKRIALEKFTKEKDELLEQAKNAGLDSEKLEQISDAIVDPSSLEVTKEWVQIISGALKTGGNDEKPRKIPTGRAMLQPSGQYENFRQIVDELYDTVLNPKATQQEKKEANKKISQLFASFIKGQKQRLRQHGSISPVYILNCPQCKEVMYGTHCQSCGYDLPAHEKTVIK